nr:hypothetical protein [Thermoanaerobaculia bacterium]
GAPISLASLERLADLWQVAAPWASPFRWAAGLVSEAHDRLGLFDPAEDFLPALVKSELCCAVLRQLTRPEGAEARRVGPWEIQDRGEDYDDPKTVLALALDEAWPVLWRILREAAEFE